MPKRNEWETIRNKFYENDNILFALPFYVECLPGIMMEFLETSQLRCCEKYLEILPALLGCKYNGTLLKGNMFAVSFIDGKMRKRMVELFNKMGQYYAKNNFFNKEVVNDFAKPEYYSKKVIFLNNMLSPLNKLFFRLVAKKLGCKKSLSYKPYQKYVL